MKRTVAGGVLFAGLLTLAGPVASASGGDRSAAPTGRGAPDGGVTRVAAVPVAAAVDATPARTAPRRPRPPAAIVVSVPFVCQVHLAGEGAGSDASD